MDYHVSPHPQFAACGLNCGLCPRFYTAGASKCPGCAGLGFAQKHPPCGLLSCCQRNGLTYCGQCNAYPCPKFAGADQQDSFITHQPQLRDLDRARKLGLPVYLADLDNKIRILAQLLTNYDAGRQKSLFCTAVNLLELADLQSVLRQLTAQTDPTAPLKENAAIAAQMLRNMADLRGISLTLRKNKAN